MFGMQMTPLNAWLLGLGALWLLVIVTVFVKKIDGTLHWSWWWVTATVWGPQLLILFCVFLLWLLLHDLTM